jgi:hypothetical protein
VGSLCPCVLRFRKDRQARGQGRPAERGCRARRRQRPLHHHGLHGTRLDLMPPFRATSRSGGLRGVSGGGLAPIRRPAYSIYV